MRRKNIIGTILIEDAKRGSPFLLGMMELITGKQLLPIRFVKVDLHERRIITAKRMI